jgi:hypothetical protein
VPSLLPFLSFGTHAQVMSGRKAKALLLQPEDRKGEGPSLANDEGESSYVNSTGVASGMLPQSSNDKSRLPKFSAQGMKTIESSATATDPRRSSTYGMFNALYEDSDGSDGR